MGRLPLLVSLDMYPHVQAAPDPKKSPSTCTHAGHHGITRRQEQLSGPKYERYLNSSGRYNMDGLTDPAKTMSRPGGGGDL
jgi:hypothetical protein